VDILSEVLTKDKVFSEVLKAEHDYWGDRRNRFIQMMEEKRERDALYELAGAKRRVLAEGLEEGLAKGLEKGVAIGRAEGRLEGKLSMASSMLADGLPPEAVAKYSGFSVEEIASLL
jgi:predicted transposase/invertase (TIGR01784 family)